MIEVQNLKEFIRALSFKPDVIMLDNMSPGEMKDAVQLINGKYLTEASGNINENNIRKIAECRVDYIAYTFYKKSGFKFNNKVINHNDCKNKKISTGHIEIY